MKSFSSVALLFLAEFVFYVSGYVMHMIAGRALGPEDYGRYGLVITATLLIANLVGSGIPVAMSKFLSETGADDPARLRNIRKKSARAQMLLMGGVTAIFFFLAPVFAALLGDPGLVPLFRFSSLIIPLYAADLFYFYLFSGMRRVAAQSGLKLVRAVMRIVAVTVLAFLFRLEGILSAYILVPLGVLAIAVAIDTLRPAIPNTAGTPDTGTGFSLREIFSLAIPITVFFFLFEILMSFDIYVLKFLSGSDTLAGEYNAALTIARIPSFLFYALTLILLPAISESHAKADLARMKETLRHALRFMIILAIPFVAVISAYPESILSVLFGGGFSDAARFLPALTTASSLLAVFYVAAFAYKGIGKILIPVSFVGAGIVLNLALDLVLLPIFGHGTVATIKLATVASLSPLFLRSVRMMFGARISATETAKVVLASGMVFLLARWGGDSVRSLFLAAIPLGALYIGLITLFRVVRKDDLALLRGKGTATVAD